MTVSEHLLSVVQKTLLVFPIPREHLRAIGIDVSLLDLHHRLLKATRSGLEEEAFDYEAVVEEASGFQTHHANPANLRISSSAIWSRWFDIP
ncbi:MAG TPA: hypothetical protein EYG54_07705 [Myxococcales bacterium]|nr:hypothetical protein [Myxococcales bacterium]